MNISEELKKQAISYNLCQPWTDSWGNPNLDELLEKYIEGIDFCIQNNYPSNKYIKENFGEIAERHGVFTDKDNIQLSALPNIVLNGNTNGSIRLNRLDVSSIYVRHGSEVRVQIEESAKAIIRVYDNASVTIDNQTNQRIFVYKYGGKVFSSGDVLVRNKKFEDL